MTAPWTPAPNPGGRNREFIRKVVAAWYAAGEIAGVGNIYPGMPWEEAFDYGQPGSIYRCNLGVHVADSSDDFTLMTGPDDPGGYVAHYNVMISIKHLAMCEPGNDSWLAAEDDHDRILDACKDRLRGQGRALGRPDVVLQAAAWPATGAIRSETDDPVYDDGVRTQWSRIFFSVTQYMQRQP